MQKLTILLFSLISFCALAQTKTAHAIKIYLEDAETGKNIPDARVTLEGFEIPAITAKYDKKENAYYFDKMPKGYNTVMAYHEKYNEKGFQNTKGLPKALKLKLYTPYRIRIHNDSANCYKEDPYRLYVYFNDTIENSSVKCDEFKDSRVCFARRYIAEHYPALSVKYNYHFFRLHRLKNLVNTQEATTPVIVVERKDKEKFKRFNDPVIKKLNEDKNILALYGILMNTKAPQKVLFDEQGKPKYLPRYIQYFNCDTLPDSYKRKGVENFGDTVNSFPQEKVCFDIGLNKIYQQKLKKGLLKYNVQYELTAKEIDSIFVPDRMKIENGELIENFDWEEKIGLSCKYWCLRGIQKPSLTPKYQDYVENRIYYKPGSDRREINSRYLPVSNNIGHYIVGVAMGLDPKNPQKNYYNIEYSYYNEAIDKFKREKERIEPVKKANQRRTENKEFFKDKTSVYRLKNNIASPFGATDLMEYYNLWNYYIFQQTQTIIKD